MDHEKKIREKATSFVVDVWNRREYAIIPEIMANPVRVLIADDFARSRAGLRALLATWSEVEVVGEAADGREAVHRVTEYQPDVVLMDVRMPVMDGLAATRLIKRFVT